VTTRWPSWRRMTGGDMPGLSEATIAPDHVTSQEEVQWNRMEPNATSLISLSCLIGSVLLLYDLTVLAKSYL